MPLETLLKELDYTDAEIQEMLANEQGRQVAATTAALDAIAQRQAAASGIPVAGDVASINSQQ